MISTCCVHKEYNNDGLAMARLSRKAQEEW